MYTLATSYYVMQLDTTHILVIQKQSEDFKLIKQALALEKHLTVKTDYVSTLKEALGRAGTCDYDLIITDLALKDAKGFKSFGALRVKAAQVPIIVLSDSDDEKVAFEAVQRGAHDYLVRSHVSDKVILRVVRYALERKRAEDKLRRTEELYHTLASNLPNSSVLLFDKKMRFQLAQGTALRDQGLSREALEGKTLQESLPPVLAEKLAGHCQKALEGHRQSFELPIRESTYLFYVIPVKNEKGSIHSGLIMSIDITDRKTLERAKDEFVNNVSHELRTPLAMIKEGISQVLEGTLGVLTADQKQFLTITHENTNRLTRIINELLDISKIEAGKVELKREYIDLVQVAKSVAATFKSSMQRAGLELRQNFSKPEIQLYADKDRLVQIFTNLVANAMKFTTKGYIEIGVRDGEGAVECYVKDTGRGIAEGNLPNVFGKFRQFGREPGPGDRGTGLGLAISKGLVELHNGQIQVASVITKGSTFTFTIPKYTAKKLFENCIAHLLKGAKNGGAEPFSILFYRIANFDQLTQTIGQEKIAEIIKKLEARITENLRRAADKTVAKDNHAILVILPETKKDKALMAAGRFQQICEDYLAQLEGGQSIRLSCNVASYPEDTKTEEEFLKKVLW